MPRSSFAGSCCTSCPRVSSASGITASWPDATWTPSWPTVADSWAQVRNQQPSKQRRPLPNQSPRTVKLPTEQVSAVHTAMRYCAAASSRPLTSAWLPLRRRGDSSLPSIPHDATPVCHSLRSSFTLGSTASDVDSPRATRKLAAHHHPTTQRHLTLPLRHQLFGA